MTVTTYLIIVVVALALIRLHPRAANRVWLEATFFMALVLLAMLALRHELPPRLR